MACKIILRRINLLEYFFPNCPPLAKEPIPNINTSKTSKHMVTATISKGDDTTNTIEIVVDQRGLTGVSDFEYPVQ